MRNNPKLAMAETRKRFLAGVRTGGSLSAGARAAGITWAEMRGWLRRDEKLRSAAKAARTRAIHDFERTGAGLGRRSADGRMLRPYKRLPPHTKWSPQTEAAVLRNLEEIGVMWKAAEGARLSEKTLQIWRRDPVLGPKIDAALAVGRQRNPLVLRRRAVREERAGRALTTESTENTEQRGSKGLGREGEGRVLRRGAQDDTREEADRAWAAMEAAPDTATLPGVPGLTLNEMRRDPAAFFTRVLGWEPWAKQTEIAEAVRDGLTTEHAESTEQKSQRRIAVRSGNGVGKTAIAARVMLWVLRCWPGSIVVTTAPTTRQVDELLWREARSAYHGAKMALRGRFYDGRSRWDLGPRRYAIGLSPDRTRAERFQGFHAETLVFIVDEASDVPAKHWEAIKGNVMGGRAVVLAIGNPTQMYGEFFDAFHGRSDLWRGLSISALEVPPIPGMATREAIEEVRADWGEGSRLWQVRVLGEFPSRSEHGLIEREWLERASRDLSPALP